jgi:hypothetical protein
VGSKIRIILMACHSVATSKCALLCFLPSSLAAR